MFKFYKFSVFSVISGYFVALLVLGISLTSVTNFHDAFAELIVIEINKDSGTDYGCNAFFRCYSDHYFRIKEGDTVKWINNDNVLHTITSGDRTNGADGIFDSGLIEPYSSFSVKFGSDSVGKKFSFYDMEYPWFKGEVKVEAGGRFDSKIGCSDVGYTEYCKEYRAGQIKNTGDKFQCIEFDSQIICTNEFNGSVGKWDAAAKLAWPKPLSVDSTISTHDSNSDSYQSISPFLKYDIPKNDLTYQKSDTVKGLGQLREQIKDLEKMKPEPIKDLEQSKPEILKDLEQLKSEGYSSDYKNTPPPLQKSQIVKPTITKVGQSPWWCFWCR